MRKERLYPLQPRKQRPSPTRPFSSLSDNLSLSGRFYVGALFKIIYFGRGEKVSKIKSKIITNKSTNIKKTKCCAKCKIDQVLNDFYTADEVLYPDSRFHLCKKCVEDIIEEKGFDGFIMILRAMNRPFLQDYYKGDWKSYITQLASLPQYRGLTFDHSVFDEGKNQTVKSGSADDIKYENEEKIYNKTWMGEFTRSEIEYLENYYAGLNRDFKIVTTNHKDYARKICKASLHMDKCFADMLSGVSGADKKYKQARETFDTLSKSAQFSESQRGQNDVSLGSFGVTFDMVEQDRWIPKHEVLEEDDYDKLIRQFSTIKESV